MRVPERFQNAFVVACALLVVVPSLVADNAVAFDVSADVVQKVAAACAVVLTVARTVFPGPATDRPDSE